MKYPVKPSSADINENVLSESCRVDLGLQESQILAAPGLAQVLADFDREVSAVVGSGATSSNRRRRTFTLVTDGQLHLRQALFPETQRKGLTLPDYYFYFHDLRKEFVAMYPGCGAVAGVQDMLKCK